MAGSMVGHTTCVPPAASSWGQRKAAMGSSGAGLGSAISQDSEEPTLLDLASGPWGLGPNHPYHQWNLVKVLETFGHLTPSQVQAKEPSPLQRSALRFAARAQQR